MAVRKQDVYFCKTCNISQMCFEKGNESLLNSYLNWIILDYHDLVQGKNVYFWIILWLKLYTKIYLNFIK